MDTGKDLGKLKRVNLRKAWKHEANDFTPWLAEPDNLESLAQALGVSELELVAVEHPVGEFKLDILCTDGDEQVVIENQLNPTDHTHLGQILTYAAGVGARKVVWIAESFRPEHISALQFLNDNTTDGLSFFGVQIELWRIDKSPLAPKFEVVVKPNDWAKTGREQARVAVTSSPAKQLQLKFWSALAAKLAKEAPNIRVQKPRPQHWYSTSIGRALFNISATANTRDGILGVELYLGGDEAKDHFTKLLLQKEDVEKQLGFELDWQELPDAKACRVATWYPDAPLEDLERWDEYTKWVMERLVAMEKVLRPIVKHL